MINEQELIRKLLIANAAWDGSGVAAYSFANRVREVLQKYMKANESQLMCDGCWDSKVKHTCGR